ncbi:MAG: hypothetical protein WBW04_07045, partial [Nitrolancea sp.]
MKPEETGKLTAQPDGLQRGDPDRDSPLTMEWQEVKQGRHPGDRYVRIVRGAQRAERSRPVARVVAHGDPDHRTRSFASLRQSIRRKLVGSPIPTEHEIHERLSKLKGLAVFAS